MHHVALDLAPAPAADTFPGDATGFQIGWDHAQYGLVPAPEGLLEGTAVSQGWRAARAVLGSRQPDSTRALRQWLALRSLAWQQGVDFDGIALGPAELARLHTSRCPVRRVPLGGAPAGDDAPTLFRLDPSIGYRPGNVVMLSRAVAVAAPGCTVADALREARAAETDGLDRRGLPAAAWRRLAALMSYVQPLPFHAGAGWPLLVLPPTGVRPRSAVQALQVLLTQQFLHAGWSRRTRELASGLPQEAQRTDFHLFVSALASRVLEGGLGARAGNQVDAQVGPSPTSLEDAWADERVQRRWRQLVSGLGEAACVAWLARAQPLFAAQDRPTGGRLRAELAARPLNARAPAQRRRAWPTVQQQP